ncbi:MAG TPA: helix-turn-helix domain-containing protein, partial [Kofleriaceae bacterium]|nr:helix-turn-helix domain-containing protein [Kofleriaceae bacterium]
MVTDGRFQEDLYYRLNVIPIPIPPLRERRDDIPVLVDHFIQKHAQRAGKRIDGMEPDVLEALQAADWPGNVRELENTVERAVVLATRPVLEVADVAPRGAIGATARPSEPAPAAPPPPTDAGDLVSLETLERQHILRVLDACGGQKTRAATVLGINRTTLWKKLRQYGLE